MRLSKFPRSITESCGRIISRGCLASVILLFLLTTELRGFSATINRLSGQVLSEVFCRIRFS